MLWLDGADGIAKTSPKIPSGTWLQRLLGTDYYAFGAYVCLAQARIECSARDDEEFPLHSFGRRYA